MRLAFCLFVVAAACVDTSTKVCEDGRLCPAQTICDTVRGRCLYPDQLTSCAGMTDGSPCSINNEPTGVCNGEVCLPSGCGDGFVKAPEQCDGANLGSAADCTDLGYYVAGTLGCSADCTYETTGCTAGGRCNDGAINGDEQCDGAELGLSTSCADLGYYDDVPLTCNAACRYETGQCTGFCGDGTVSGPEQCEGTSTGIDTCMTRGFYAGTLACDVCRFDTSGCSGTCGDGIVQTGDGEECDGTNLNSSTCMTEQFYGGTLTCLPNCKLDRTQCTGFCGDGVKNGTEVCDNLDAGADTCGAHNFYSGFLSCNPTCTAVSTGTCSGRCGDNLRNGSEACDGSDFGMQSCASFGFYSGTLSCNAGCGSINTSACSGNCGDLTKNGIEQCDGSDLGTFTCASFQRYTGTPTCNSNCTISSTGCSQFCGDNVRNGPEICDNTDQGGFSCATYGWYFGTLLCQSNCIQHDKSACGGYCGDASLHTDYGEQCDGFEQASCFDIGALAGSMDCDAFCGTEDRCQWGTARFASSPLQRPIRGIYAPGANNIYVISDPEGTNLGVAHWDGYLWIFQPFPEVGTSTPENLRAIHGTGPNDIWVAGSLLDANALNIEAIVAHWDGNAWSSFAVNTQGRNITGIYAAAANDVWLVGDAGLLMHYAGGSPGTWQYIAPSPFGSIYMNGIHGSSGSNIYAVGGQSAMYRYNGSTWNFVTTNDMPAFTELKSVWVWSNTHAWVVGYTSGNVGFAAFLAGDPTNPVNWYMTTGGTTPYVTLASNQRLNAVFGTSPSDVIVVGDGGTVMRGNRDSISDLGHYVDFVSLTSGTTNSFNAVGGVPGDVWLGGNVGTLRRYDGRWGEARTGFSTVAISGVSSTAIWVGGDQITGIRRYDGTTWVQEAQYAQTYMNGIFALSASRGWAVADYTGTNPTSGRILMNTSGSWSIETSVSENLFDVWGTSETDVWAVGATTLGNPVIYHRTGAGWGLVPGAPGDPGDTFFAVHGSGPNDVWAVGEDSAIWHFNGSAWAKSTNAGTIATLNSVWASAPGEAWAVGDNGTILHYNGTFWDNAFIQNFAFVNLTGVWGTSTSDVWAVGDNGIALHWDGVSWTRSDTGDNFAFSGVWATANPPNVFGVGSSSSFRLFRLSHPLPTFNGGRCTAPISLYCGQPPIVGAVMTSSPNAFNTYASCGPETLSGGEVYYRLETPVTGTVNISLTPHAGDLDLIVVGADSKHRCDTAVCKGDSHVAGLAEDQVLVNTLEGQTLYVIIDGVAANTASGYTLDIVCTKQ